MLVNQPKRPAEQVDAGGNDRRTDPRIIEHERLDEVIDVAAVIGRVDDPALLRGIDGELLAFADALDLSQDWIERVLERAIQLVTLRRLQLVEVLQHARARGIAGQAVTALEKPGDVLTREYGFGNAGLPPRGLPAVG